jgi:Do/DeqQ family serine protease
MRIMSAVVLAFAVAWGGGVVAQTRVAPESRQQLTLSFAPVVQKTANTVVNVYGSNRAQRPRNPFAEDDLFKRFFGDDGSGGMPRERAQQSLGSGVLADASGLVVTNHHVIESLTEVRVSLPDRREFEAEIVLRDPRTDLAVLKLKSAEKFPTIEIGDSDGLQVGDIVLAIGNPFGVGQTVTQGIVSALARTQVGVSDYQFFIQTDAAINPGNSGGALVDMSGRLVGINTAIFSRTGASHGIGFAIPASMVKVVVDSAKGGGKSVRRPWFGATLQNVSSDVSEAMGLDRPTGALVARVFDKGPAADSGLKRGDLILAVDGQAIENIEAFGFRFATKSIGGVVTLKVRRTGKELIVPVKTAAAPETRDRDALRIGGRAPFSGAMVANLSPAVAEELSMDIDSSGVVITDVDQRSPAGQIGFRKGDIILAVNNQKIESSRDLEKIARDRTSFWRITVNRGGQVFTSVFGG